MRTSRLGGTVGRWGELAPAGPGSLEPLLWCPTHVCFVFLGSSPLARGRLKITALTIKVPALWPLTALRRQRLTLRATVPTARAARAWARARPPGVNVKGQSLLPGTQAKFLSYLQPGPQWGIVLGLKGHRAGPEWTQAGSAWQSKHRPPWPVPPGSAACVSLLGERFFLQRSVGVPAPPPPCG